MTDSIEQGPDAGRTWPAERERFTDDETGATVHRLTTHPGDDHHLYFTESGWYDGGRRLLLRSERSGERDLYSIDLETGRITRLTDLPGAIRGITCHAGVGEAYCWHDDALLAIDLEDRSIRTRYRMPEGYGPSSVTPGADGEYVYATYSEDVDVEGHREIFEAAPRSRVVRVPTAGESGAEVVVEEEAWISHVNASPARPELFVYCHEGPWHLVENRIWGVDAETGERWRVRPTGEGEAVGHEYWLADGEHVGYHGWSGGRDDPDPFFGTVRYDDRGRREAPAPDIYTHFHANDREFAICDGTHRGIPYTLAWRYDGSGDAYRGPRKLAYNGWESSDESVDPHPHSRLSPDGETVVFDSARGGEASDVYLVEVPDFDELPALDEGAGIDP